MSEPRVERTDRQFKTWLLVTSLVTLVLLAVAALRENVFTPWRMIRHAYAGILNEKATDARSKAIADQFEIRITQNVIPELGTIDRCTTCHPGIEDPRMVDQRQPFRTHPGDYLEYHPPERFGCTICHRGQGRALVFEEAKAEGHHWDYPLLPKELTQSSCGMCHTAEEAEHRGGEVYALGKRLYESKGCASCHQLNGRGGSLGPALDNVGLKVRGQLPMAHVQGPHTLAQWLIEHFEDPQRVVVGSKMKPPQLSRDEITALTVYMLSLQDRDLPRSYLSPAKHLEYYRDAHPAPETGEQLFQRYCTVCHDTGTYGRYDAFFRRFIPAVRGPSLIASVTPDYLFETIRKGRPGTEMTAWGADAGGLADDEIRRIVTFLLADAPAESQARTRAWDASLVSQGDPGRGVEIFTKHCIGCHGPAGIGHLGPALANPEFQRVASDGFLFVTIAMGRKNTAMPAFLGRDGLGFAAGDLWDVVSFVRTLGTWKSQQSARVAVAAQDKEVRP